MLATDKQKLSEKWRFPWPVMEVLIAGKSTIDLPLLNITSLAEATEFIRSYGYDPLDRDDQRKMHRATVEAYSFIEQHLMPKEWAKGRQPDAEVLFCRDVRQLLLWASDQRPENVRKRVWSCAVLRVIHTIAHIEGVNRHTRLETAREQIMGRFHRQIFRDGDGVLWLGDEGEKIELEKVEWKYQKARESIILKLLHKRGNVAETVYDLLGVRIITKRLCDVLLVVKYLRKFHMVTFPNCVPNRSRNTLVDVDRYRSQVETLRDMLNGGTLPPEEFEAMVTKLGGTIDPVRQSNPHSSSSYRSIQLTCRQLIRTANPQLQWLEKFSQLKTKDDVPEGSLNLLKELSHLVEGWHEVRSHREIKAFYPFEVQVMDREAYKRSTRGSASHDLYKRSQVRAARRRVLRDVLKQC